MKSSSGTFAILLYKVETQWGVMCCIIMVLMVFKRNITS